ncbi:MAG: precorrin-6y C5,15-methyltransferase (decarboxylating) subunit CbiE [Bacillota bacterium]
MNKVLVLGIGPGDPDYILPVVKQKIAGAEILIGGKRILKNYKNSDKKLVAITANINKVSNYIKNHYRDYKIAVLVSGTPGLYSFLKYLKKHLSSEELEVFPGISSLQLAFARNKMVWQDAEILSLHGKNNMQKLLKAVKKKEKVGIFTDENRSPDFICKYLLEKGYNKKKVFIGENLSYKSEKIYKGRITDFVNNEFAPLSVMVIYDEKS